MAWHPQVDGNKVVKRPTAEWRAPEAQKPYSAVETASYVGFVLGKGIGGVDLDGCRDPETGVVADWAQWWIDRFSSYTEISPSGTGFKIYASEAPALLARNVINMDGEPVDGKRPQIEAYVQARWFAVTGQHVKETPTEVRDVPEAWAALVQTLDAEAQEDCAGSLAERSAGRNDYLTRFAGLIRFQGANDEQVAQTLSEVNARADPEEFSGFSEGPLSEVELRGIINSACKWSQGIRVDEGREAESASNLEHALNASGAGLYNRGGQIVRAAAAAGDAPRIARATTATVIDVASDNVRFVKYDGRNKGDRPVGCPDRVAKVLIDRGSFSGLPALRGVVQAPTLRADGSAVTAPGYDRRSELLLDHGLACSVPVSPTRGEALAALGKLQRLVAEFPFRRDADKSVALAGMLTVLVRHALPAAPMFLVASPVAGTGKSLLVDLCSILASGSPVPTMGQSHRDEELEKRLDAALLGGALVTSIDNVERPLRSDKLCSILTQASVIVRVLGASENVVCPTVITMFATGNNATVHGDLVRRTVVCELDAEQERPDTRTFKIRDVRRYAKANRGELVTAALTVLRAWLSTGETFQGPVAGSFEQWSQWIRGALVWLGEADPVDTQKALRAEDPAREELSTFMSAWYETRGDRELTVAQLADAQAVDRDELSVVLHQLAGERGDINRKRLGRWLQRNRDAPVDGLVLRRRQASKRSYYRVMEA